MELCEDVYTHTHISCTCIVHVRVTIITCLDPRRTQKRAMAAVKEGEGLDALPGQRIDIHVCGVPGDAAARIMERVGAWQRVRAWQKGIVSRLISWGQISIKQLTMPFPVPHLLIVFPLYLHLTGSGRAADGVWAAGARDEAIGGAL